MDHILRTKELLDGILAQCTYEQFVHDDPISLPHAYSLPQDREIVGFWVAVLAWGQRKTIINKGRELFDRMDGRPYEFVRHHGEEERRRLLGFVHRTFNDTDALYFLDFLQRHYTSSDTLQDAFCPPQLQAPSMAARLDYFRDYFFSAPYAPARTYKHIPSPARGSSCKRLNMFLRWMVRKDALGVDFGLWERIAPSELVCPLDVHVQRVAQRLGLLERTQQDWRAAMELTENLRKLDAEDPVKYDLALFSAGVQKIL